MNTTDVTRAFRIRQVQAASTRTIRIRRPRARASLAARTSSSQRGGRWRLRRTGPTRQQKRTMMPTGTPLAPRGVLAPPGPICAGRTIRGETMAERVEPPTVMSQPQHARRTTVPGAQRRQRLAAILPEPFDLAFYRDCWPTRERYRVRSSQPQQECARAVGAAATRRCTRARGGPGKFSMALSTEELELHGRCGLYDLRAPRDGWE